MQRLLGSLWASRRALLVYAFLLVFGWYVGGGLADIAAPELASLERPMITGMVVTALVAYVLFAAIPFVPGAEIGLALLVVFGAKAAPVVYFGMVGALLIAYATARMVPLRVLSSVSGWMGLKAITELVHALDGKNSEERAQIVSEWFIGTPAGWIARNRYVALGIAINTPGNALLGGGGGLAFAAGLSGLYKPQAFLAVIMIAVAPVPLLFFLIG